jgi:hypothetical protein
VDSVAFSSFVCETWFTDSHIRYILVHYVEAN